MTGGGYTIFPTALGWSGVAWRGERVLGASLPIASAETMRGRFARRFPNLTERDAPGAVALAIEGVCALLRGERAPQLDELVLEMDGVAELPRRVYEVTRTIPRGSTLTYGAIAAQLGDRNAARAVGRALGDNPFAPIVPCHRVLAADGTMHGFSAAGGVAMKLRLLELEGWRAQAGPSLFEEHSAPR
ncbi:MAG TPA: methylated-DNA--[protein]-cysteine S-methyltransferase [Candidatus Baltobacteraceae bacterium]|nr:methylated-DNA--[protein]-cysteine S-methyltransferase [Candidatus Baltobacteraceae bacterium]